MTWENKKQRQSHKWLEIKQLQNIIPIGKETKEMRINTIFWSAQDNGAVNKPKIEGNRQLKCYIVGLRIRRPWRYTRNFNLETSVFISIPFASRLLLLLRPCKVMNRIWSVKWWKGGKMLYADVEKKSSAYAQWHCSEVPVHFTSSTSNRI